MARTPWLESACRPRHEGGDFGRSQEEVSSLSSLSRQDDIRLAASSAGVSLEAMSKGRYIHLARIGLLLVALILFGVFACPPRAYAPHSHANIAGLTADTEVLAPEMAAAGRWQEALAGDSWPWDSPWREGDAPTQFRYFPLALNGRASPTLGNAQASSSTGIPWHTSASKGRAKGCAGKSYSRIQLAGILASAPFRLNSYCENLPAVVPI